MNNINYLWHRIDSEWGTTIHIIEDNSRSYCKIYWYKDDLHNLYISDLHVSKIFRDQGYGTHLLNHAINFAILHYKNNIILAVVKDSWIYNWYIRLGFKDHSDHEEDNLIWMIKEI